MMHFLVLAATFAPAFCVAASGLIPKAYLSLPLGQVKPAGWLEDQLNIQVNGIAGHQHEFYTWVSESDWTGGDQYYSDLEEAGPYWFNAMVPTAFLSDNEVLINRTQYFLDYVLDRQEPGGWFGPEVNTTKPRYLWARYLFFFGATQLVEADPSRLNKTLNAMYSFFPLAHDMLQNGTGLEDGWGEVRWQELQYSLQWLYDNYPNGQEVLLLDTMNLVRQKGLDWNTVFAAANFPTEAVTWHTGMFHGVNTAQALHAAAVGWRVSQNETDRAAIDEAWDVVFKYHGRPSGTFAADEFLAGLEPARGTELCLVVEQMFSGSYVFQLTGDTKFADRTERTAYNALPAEMTPNMWSHQYLQQQNQIGAQVMTPNPFPGDNNYSNVFGLEPNYPCCTVNHPQGFAKFISNAFVTTADKSSLLQVYIGPFNVKTQLSSGNSVQVSVKTQYPFSDIVQTTITAEAAFTYQVRVPSWVTNGTISTGTSAPKALSPVNGFQSIDIKPGTTTFSLTYPSEITIEDRLHGAVAVHRGPLHYALLINHNQTQLPSNPDRFSQPESQAVDLQFDAISAWAYAIDPNSLKFNPSKLSLSSSLPSPVYDDGAPPVSISALGCAISWPIAGSVFADSPPENATCTGASVNLTLVPYGATRLRIGELPTVSLLT